MVDRGAVTLYVRCPTSTGIASVHVNKTATSSSVIAMKALHRLGDSLAGERSISCPFSRCAH